MKTDIELPGHISEQIAEFQEYADRSTTSKKIFHLISDFTDYTAFMIKRAEWIKVKKSFDLADALYMCGNNEIRLAIENLFIYRIGTVLDFVETDTKVKAIQLLSPNLQFVYSHQIYASGN